MMNDIEQKAQHLRNKRKKFDLTLAAIKPRLSVRGLVDEAAGQMMKRNRSDTVVFVFAVAAVAWLINTLSADRKSDKPSHLKTSTLKPENNDYENASTSRRYNQSQNSTKRQDDGASREIENKS